MTDSEGVNTLYEDLMVGFKELGEYARGERELRVTTIQSAEAESSGTFLADLADGVEALQQHVRGERELRVATLRSGSSETPTAVDVQAFLDSHPQTRMSSDEIARRAGAIYATMREHIDTPENLGRFFSIEIESGDTELGGRLDSGRNLRLRHPDGVIYTLKVGYPAAIKMGGRSLPSQRRTPSLR